MKDVTFAVAQTAARMVVESGLEYGAAKRRALKTLGLSSGAPLPDNHLIEQAVREHIALFCQDTQPAQLLALRELALLWMNRLRDFEPLIAGAVWRGTATRLSDIYLHLFADDAKTVEIALMDRDVNYEVGNVPGLHGQIVDALSIHAWCEGLREEVGIHLLINSPNAQRGSLLADAHGEKMRGTMGMLQMLLQIDAGQGQALEYE